jgi:hypothetical protein
VVCWGRSGAPRLKSAATRGPAPCTRARWGNRAFQNRGSNWDNHPTPVCHLRRACCRYGPIWDAPIWPEGSADHRRAAKLGPVFFWRSINRGSRTDAARFVHQIARAARFLGGWLLGLGGTTARSRA